jgi:glycosyltransferase involved in cell wall biosynthesis
MSAPLVSVVMPLWKPKRHYLARAIESIRAQTLEEWELILIEDPPHESREDIRALGDSRIRYEARPIRQTLADALNQGLTMAASTFVARMDADDMCTPDRLKKQVIYLREHPDVSLVGSSVTVIDESERIIGHRSLPRTAEEIAATIRRFNCIAHSSVMFRRDVILSAGGYDNRIRTEDYDLWCRLIAAGHRLANLPDELLLYRFHEEAMKFDAVHDVIRSTIATKQKYFEGKFTIRDRIRIAAERALLLVPPQLILSLFRSWEYAS